jgi:hypothetical protein
LFTTAPVTADCTVAATFESASETEVSNGHPVGEQRVSLKGWAYYFIEVPDGVTELTFSTTNATADVDIFTQHVAKPTASDYVCRAVTASGNEVCSTSDPMPGLWWLGVFGYRAASYFVSAGFAMPATHIITPLVGPGGFVTPVDPQTVPEGAEQTFFVSPDDGFLPILRVGGTCPLGRWSGDTWTTGAIDNSCTVVLDFVCWACVPNAGGWRALIGR